MQLSSVLRAGLLAMKAWLRFPFQLGPQWGAVSHFRFFSLSINPRQQSPACIEIAVSPSTSKTR
ncbi:hypothetical protein BHC62_25170 [Pseudomonas sp. 06C 126]|nr:hypothetical protein BHC62_25170 [Pseudomonas sp. 06C 126]